MWAKYRKKPVEIEALQWTGANVTEVITFVGHKVRLAMPNVLVIETLEGRMHASPGDFIIRGVAGEFYPCKPEIFAQTYDLVPAAIAASSPGSPSRGPGRPQGA